MAVKKISPVKKVAGRLLVPGDKSISHRAIILGSLSVTSSTIENFLTAEDCLCTLEAFRALGVPIEREGTRVRIQGKGLDGLKMPKAPIWCGNSGTTTRLLMGVLTGQSFPVELKGDASLSRRPMSRVIEPLSQMGGNFLVGRDAFQSIHLPLRMQGTRSVRTLDWKSPVASAQVKSAILLAGLYASGKTRVSEPSRSRDHTERMLRACGVSVEQDATHVSVTGTATLRAKSFQVPGDLSSAAFFWAAGLLLADGELTVQDVGVNPTRTGFLDIVKAMGGAVQWSREHDAMGEPVADIGVRRSALRGIEISGELIPRAIDEYPILAVLATQAQGRTIIRDAQELRVKESDRITAVREELSLLGAHIAEHPDGLEIEGPTPLRGAAVHSHGDHRLAMALAIAGLIAEGETTIDEVECVQTSFPNFWELLASCGTH